MAEALARKETAIEPYRLTAQDVMDQVRLIQEIMGAVMKKDEHYGIIPGTEKPTLYKAGAEKLSLTFRFDPEYHIDREWDGPHLTAYATCTLYHIVSGNRIASGLGCCSTKETKYAYRKAERKCPSCGKEAIIKGKAEYGGGWLCFKKRGGCGEKFPDNDPAIAGMDTGKVANPNLADTYNTIVKMACKRALVAAVLNGTAASDIFTQDLEDYQENGGEVEKDVKPPPEKPTAKATSPKPEDGWRPDFKEALTKLCGTESKAVEFLGTQGYESWDQVPSREEALKIHKNKAKEKA